MQFSIKFSINFKRSAPPASRQTDSTDSMHSDILARSAKINISAVGTTLPILARRAVILAARKPNRPTEPTEPTMNQPNQPHYRSASMQFSKISFNLQWGFKISRQIFEAELPILSARAHPASRQTGSTFHAQRHLSAQRKNKY